MKTWIIIACGIGASYYFSDVRSPYLLENLLAPLLLLIFVLATVIKLVLISGTTSRGAGRNGHDGGFTGLGGSHNGSNSSNSCGGDGGDGEFIGNITSRLEKLRSTLATYATPASDTS